MGLIKVEKKHCENFEAICSGAGLEASFLAENDEVKVYEYPCDNPFAGLDFYVIKTAVCKGLTKEGYEAKKKGMDGFVEEAKKHIYNQE
jgi:hypothetical protein